MKPTKWIITVSSLFITGILYAKTLEVDSDQCKYAFYKNDKAAESICLKMAKAGDPESARVMGDIHQNRSQHIGDLHYKKALEWYLTASALGSASANTILGMLYFEEGRTLEAQKMFSLVSDTDNLAKLNSDLIDYFELDRNNILNVNQLSARLLKSIFKFKHQVEENHARLSGLNSNDATLDDIYRTYLTHSFLASLDLYYIQGDNNSAESILLELQSLRKWDLLHQAGMEYINNKGLYSEGMSLLQLSAIHGAVDESSLKLGLIYSNPNLKYYDIHKAKKYLIASLSSGNIKAQYSLGILYGRPGTVLHNNDLAYQNILIAAEAGLAEAQYDLAIAYFNGLGTNKDYQIACKWLRLSYEGGDQDAIAQYKEACEQVSASRKRANNVER